MRGDRRNKRATALNEVRRIAEHLRRHAEQERVTAEQGRRRGFERSKSETLEAVREQAEVLSEMRASAAELGGKEPATLDEPARRRPRTKSREGPEETQASEAMPPQGKSSLRGPCRWS